MEVSKDPDNLEAIIGSAHRAGYGLFCLDGFAFVLYAENADEEHLDYLPMLFYTNVCTKTTPKLAEIAFLYKTEAEMQALKRRMPPPVFPYILLGGDRRGSSGPAQTRTSFDSVFGPIGFGNSPDRSSLAGRSTTTSQDRLGRVFQPADSQALSRPGVH